MTIRFKDHQKTLYAQAWTAHMIKPEIPFDDFVSAGHEIFMKCQTKYRKHRREGKAAKFNTYYTSSLKKYFCGMQPKANEVSYEEELPYNQNPESLLIFKDCLKNLGDDARFVANLILESPTDYIQACSKFTCSEIRQYLRTIWHGDEVQNRISLAFSEIKHLLKTL